MCNNRTSGARFSAGILSRMQRSDTPPDDHLASLPDAVRDDMTRLDAAISRVMHGLDRVVWEGKFWGGSEQRIIGYGDYRYTARDRSEVDWFIVGLAAQKNHLSVYVSAVEDGAYLTRRYADRLGKVKVGSSAISFKRLADVDLDVLLELVARSRELMAPA